MSNYRKLIQVFVASPGDVAAECRRLAKVVTDLNGQLAEHLGVQLELKEWWQVAPNMGRPEDVILDHLQVKSWDVFIGILWLRFGMPPGQNRTGEDFDSGTEEEFHLAFRAWQEKQRPSIRFYRCTRPLKNMGRLDEDQFAKVQKFCRDFEPAGRHPGLCREFQKTNEFEELVKKHLTDLCFNESQASVSAPTQPQAPPIQPAERAIQTPEARPDKKASHASQEQVVRLWAEATDVIQKGVLSELFKSKSLDQLIIARLGLVTASMVNRGHEAHSSARQGERPKPNVPTLGFIAEHDQSRPGRQNLSAFRGLLRSRAGLGPFRPAFPPDESVGDSRSLLTGLWADLGEASKVAERSPLGAGRP